MRRGTRNGFDPSPFTTTQSLLAIYHYRYALPHVITMHDDNPWNVEEKRPAVCYSRAR